MKITDITIHDYKIVLSLRDTFFDWADQYASISITVDNDQGDVLAIDLVQIITVNAWQVQNPCYGSGSLSIPEWEKNTFIQAKPETAVLLPLNIEVAPGDSKTFTFRMAPDKNIKSMIGLGVYHICFRLIDPDSNILIEKEIIINLGFLKYPKAIHKFYKEENYPLYQEKCRKILDTLTANDEAGTKIEISSELNSTIKQGAESGFPLETKKESGPPPKIESESVEATRKAFLKLPLHQQGEFIQRKEIIEKAAIKVIGEDWRELASDSAIYSMIEELSYIEFLLYLENDLKIHVPEESLAKRDDFQQGEFGSYLPLHTNPESFLNALTFVSLGLDKQPAPSLTEEESSVVSPDRQTRLKLVKRILGAILIISFFLPWIVKFSIYGKFEKLSGFNLFMKGGLLTFFPLYLGLHAFFSKQEKWRHIIIGFFAVGSCASFFSLSIFNNVNLTRTAFQLKYGLYITGSVSFFLLALLLTAKRKSFSPTHIKKQISRKRVFLFICLLIAIAGYYIYPHIFKPDRKEMLAKIPEIAKGIAVVMDKGCDVSYGASDEKFHIRENFLYKPGEYEINIFESIHDKGGITFGSFADLNPDNVNWKQPRTPNTFFPVFVFPKKGKMITHRSYDSDDTKTYPMLMLHLNSPENARKLTSLLKKMISYHQDFSKEELKAAGIKDGAKPPLLRNTDTNATNGQTKTKKQKSH